MNVGRWLVRETTDEVHARFWKALERLDTAMQPSHVRRGWDGMLAEEAVERVRAEAAGLTECVEPPQPYLPLIGEYRCVNCGLYRGEHIVEPHTDGSFDGDMLCPKQFTRFVKKPGSAWIFEYDPDPEPHVSPAAGAPVPPPEVADEGPSVVEHSSAPTEGHPNELSPLAQCLRDAVGDNYDHGRRLNEHVWLNLPLWHDEFVVRAIDWEAVASDLLGDDRARREVMNAWQRSFYTP